MSSLISICLVLGLPLLAMGQVADIQGLGDSSAVTLAQLRDRARPLLIFAPAADDGRLLEQVRIMDGHAKEAADRDLIAVVVAEGGGFGDGHHLGGPDAAEARRRFHVEPGEFVVVLVGKDGGEKLRSAKPFGFERLRDVIDAMPMRRDEVRGKGR